MASKQRKLKKTQKQSRLNPRTRSFIYILLAGFGLVIFLTAGGFTFAATQEQNDAFCSSCHTQPESTYYQRSIGTQAVDLASAHKKENTRCIDCHSTTGVIGRVNAELLGAHNALAFYTHTAVQPAVQTKPITDESCLKCHQGVSDRSDMNNHFHFFLPRWQAADPNAATCVSCHQGHSDNGDPNIKFLNRETTQTVCEACHRFASEGR